MHSILSYNAYALLGKSQFVQICLAFWIEWGQNKYLDGEAPDTNYSI